MAEHGIVHPIALGDALGVSTDAVICDWKWAKARLYRELMNGAPDA